jgi:3-phenylpropionate/cinnamic acid dioxygenase small subunit
MFILREHASPLRVRVRVQENHALFHERTQTLSSFYVESRTVIFIFIGGDQDR